ncbi:imelysin family protein [Abyssalbus ytuae]|uniref:Imelysin-like domain-containing protein n=1 Tax=Abyssalbus ytuae TaxID=2926907 RepID=A0A9E7D2B6_9FLAO|nr:imelysin family protein [Abyssalbus ytuae]UOB17993.1 hypothetical protein MQE35_01535 [Abyssalbus ytuae]
MKKLTKSTLLLFGGLLLSCSSDDNGNGQSSENIQKSEVIENYANIVLANYEDSYDAAVQLKVTIDAFVADPTENNFEAAKQAWKTAREPYGQTEAFRFASGPIDDEDGPEGLLNAWPLDEVYIDYVEGDEDAGIINDLTTYPTINRELLISLNNVGGEKNITVGYHAIEFLLWGQDLGDPSDETAGQRPYTDYVDGGTAANQDRRRQYLAICADLLTDHLQLMIDEWKEGGAYRTTFLSLNEDTALKNMLSGIGTLAASELSGERMFTALFNQDQEDEHSCFSDNTHRDIRLNLQGIANVYRGSYKSVNGPSLEDLFEEADTELGAEISAQLADAETTVNATGIPFDLAISTGQTSEEGQKVLNAVNALQDLGDKFVQGGAAIGITISTDIPE